MTRCRSDGCLGWTLAEGDRFCAWCGARLIDLRVDIEVCRDSVWTVLAPAILSIDQRPELRVAIRNTGQSGTLPIQPDSVKSTVPWLELDLAGLQETRLKPGESLPVSVIRFKPPDPGESRSEAGIQVVLGALSTPLQAEARLHIVPRPRFELEMPKECITLLADVPNLVPLTVVLARGRTTLVQAPELLEGWGTVQLPDSVAFPLELDGERKSRLPLRLALSSESIEGITPPVVLRGTLRLRTGQKDAPLDLPLQLDVNLSPELYVEPFRDSRHSDWTVVRGINDKRPLEIVLSNGFPGISGRADLEIRHLDISCRDTPVGWLQGELPGTHLRSGQSLRLPLTLNALSPGQAAIARLTFDTNSSRSAAYFLHVRCEEPEEFPGWLVIDLGTTNTCAALIDENQAFEMIPLDEPDFEKPETLPSVVGYQRLVSAREYQVGDRMRSLAALPDIARSVVMAAKRWIGDDRKHFDVVPEREPMECCSLAPREVLRDIYRHVVRRAMDAIVRRGSRQVLLTRSLITHPSRFTMQQIEELKQAIQAAMRDAIGEVDPARVDRVLAPMTLHEPVGAALHFLSDWTHHAQIHERKKTDEIDYRLLVYDFGGGTVDITLLGVKSTRSLRAGARVAPPAPELTQKVQQEDLLLQSLVQTTIARSLEALRQDFGAAVVLPVDGVGDADLARKNSFLVEQFARSVLGVLPRPALLASDEEQWGRLRNNPHVNETLHLTYQQNDRKVGVGLPRDRILPTVAAVVQSLMGSRPKAEHPYTYTVTPEVMGATGHRWLGGEDVTHMVRDLLVEKIRRAVCSAEKTEDVALPVDAAACPVAQAPYARKNDIALRDWAEKLKLLLSRGASTEEIGTTYRNLDFWIDGKHQEYPRRRLLDLSPHPSLDEVHARLEPALRTTLAMARSLAGRQPGRGPDVVLRVGKASLLPLVGRMLQSEFPQAQHLAPREAKECVVQGACLQPLPGSGVMISAPQDRPGVRLVLSTQGRLAVTTSRIGIKVVDAGRAWFYEMVPVGEPIPAAGLRKRMPGFGLFAGSHPVPVLENAGTRNELVLDDGKTNPNIQELGRFQVAVPTDVPPEQLQDVDLELHLDPQMVLHLSVHLGGRSFGPFELQVR